MSLALIAHENAKKRRYTKEFERSFNVPFSCYFDNIRGLDLIRLDEEVIKTPAEQDMEGFVREKYGQATVDLLLNLI